jgi:hypothetical protein
MNTIASSSEQNAHHETLTVKVRYAASGKPYVDPKASSNETLATLKQQVLVFFGLVEGNVDGGHKVYVLTSQGVQQTDLSVQLGQLAQGAHHLELNLIEQFIQG